MAFVPRARAGFAAPQVQVVGPGPEYDAIQRGFEAVKGIAREQQAQAAQRFHEKQVADDAAALINAQNDYHLKLTEASLRLQKEVPESGDGYEKALASERMRIRQDVLKTVPSFISKSGKASIERMFSRMDGDSAVDAKKWQDDATNAWVKDSVIQSVNAQVSLVLDNPEAHDDALQFSLTRAESVNGRMTPDEQRAMRDNIVSEIGRAKVVGYARKGNFEGAMQSIQEVAPRIGVNEQIALETSVANEIKSYNRRLAGEQKQREDATSLELAQKFIARTLTQQDVYNAIPNLSSGEAARSWSNALDERQRRDEERRKDAVDDQRTAFTRLTEDSFIGAIDNGSMTRTEVILAAVETYAQGLMDESGIGRVVSEFDKRQDENYKTYLKVVEAPFKQGGLLEKLDTTKETARALAMAEFRDRWDSIKDLSKERIYAEVENIVSTAKKDVFGLLPQIPTGDFLAGNPQSLDDIQNARAKLIQKAQAEQGTLGDAFNEDYYNNQLYYLNAWEQRLGMIGE